MTLPPRSSKTAFAICLAVAGFLFQSSGIAATHTVNVGPGLSYSPSHLTINVGDTVQFHFNLATATVTHGSNCLRAVNPLFDSSTTFSVTFTQAGSYPYFSSVGSQCQQGMTGVITVVASAPPPTPAPLSFDPSQTFGIGGNGFLESVAVGDVNGDGIDDAVAIASSEQRPGRPPTSFISTVFGNADTLAYYLEAKYKFTPQFFGALRWNQQLFSKVDVGGEKTMRWGQDLGRVDVAAGYRFTSHTQLKLQYSFQQQTNGPQDNNHLFAAQLTIRF